MSESTDTTSDAPSGPADPHTAGPDAPTAPGGPQRADAAAGSVTPGEAGAADADQPERHPTSTTDDAPHLRSPASTSEPTADGEVHARTQTDQVNEELQEENAETSLDQPSDGSGSE